MLTNADPEAISLAAVAAWLEERDGRLMIEPSANGDRWYVMLETTDRHVAIMDPDPLIAWRLAWRVITEGTEMGDGAH